ncbi:MAG: TfoX/Sxy family protein [Myxococcota bacterium]
MSHIARKTRTRHQMEEIFREALPDDTEIRDLDGSPAGFTNGHLFARIRKDQFIVRLGEADRKRLSTRGGVPFEPIKGRPMAEYSVLPDAIIDDAVALREWIARGHGYVRTLETQASAATPRAAASARSIPTARLEKTKV